MNTMEMFGLNKNQLQILYSFEFLITNEDISNEKEVIMNKEIWLTEWENVLGRTMEDPIPYKKRKELIDALKKEAGNGENNTWLYLVLLEATVFTPYVALGDTKEEIKKYKDLKFHSQKEFIKKIVDESGLVSSDYIDRFEKTYNKTIDQLTGKWTKYALGAVSVVAIAAIVAASAGIAAGPIAVALFGSEFAGLSGAALTSACLAMAGGGAIAAGGAGMAGGVLAIAGGGALLGAAGGGAAVSTISALVQSSPTITLTQAAKLEVVLKEITINAQHDIQMAQNVMEALKQQIVELKKRILDLENGRKEDKKIISQIEKSLSYLEKAYKDMIIFKSSYEEGVNSAQREE